MAISATKDVHQTTVGSTRQRFSFQIFEKNNKKGPIFEVGRERHDKLFETIFQLHRQRPKEQQQETSGGGGTKRRQIASRTDGARLSVPHPKGNPTPKLRVYYPHQKINK